MMTTTTEGMPEDVKKTILINVLTDDAKKVYSDCERMPTEILQQAKDLVKHIHAICSAFGRCRGAVPPELADRIIEAERATRSITEKIK